MRRALALVLFAACSKSGPELYKKAQQLDQPGHRAEALTLFLEACDKGVLAACNDASVTLSNGDEVPKDLPKAKQLLEKACAGGDVLACTNLGTDLREAGDTKRGDELLGRACAGNVARACGILALSAPEGTKEQRELLEKASALGEPGAATVLASKLINAGHELPRAESLLARACGDQHALACSLLGHLYNGTAGFPPDAKKALAAFQRGCDLSAFECNELASALDDLSDGGVSLLRKAELFEKACNAGNGTGCFNRARDEENADAARELLEKGCKQDEPMACEALSKMQAAEAE